MVDKPSFDDRPMVTLNFAVLAHPVKSIVTGVITELCSAISPSESGKVGFVTAGVHFLPDCWEIAKLSI